MLHTVKHEGLYEIFLNITLDFWNLKTKMK